MLGACITFMLKAVREHFTAPIIPDHQEWTDGFQNPF